MPPWWPPYLAAAAGAQHRTVLTSRNFGLAIRRAISSRNPDFLKSSGGGSNSILVRGEIRGHRARRLCWWPERRWAHGVLLDDGWVVNVHTSTLATGNARRDTLRALGGWEPLLLFGGDVNMRGKPELPGLTRVGGNHVDHLYTTGRPALRVEVLDRGKLSDHPPVRVTL